MSDGLTLDTIDIVGNRTYGEHGYPHAAWAFLRREAPLYWYDRPDARPPFWAGVKTPDSSISPTTRLETDHSTWSSVSSRPSLSVPMAVKVTGSPPVAPVTRVTSAGSTRI